MADSLVLTGVKDVRKHTGTEMLRLNPKGGGDTFQLKRWWVGAGVSTCYEPCTVFDVTTAVGTVKLALATKAEGSRVRIDHDGSFNFSFFGAGELSRACLFTDAFEVIEHYVFPSISGGKVMTVTPAGGASRPIAAPFNEPVEPEPVNEPTETGPKAVEGYFPVYDIEANAIAASADGAAHTHTLSGITYYMPTGGTLGADFYHGDYGSNSGGGY